MITGGEGDQGVGAAPLDTGEKGAPFKKFFSWGEGRIEELMVG